jgi:hypothetical protein
MGVGCGGIATRVPSAATPGDGGRGTGGCGGHGGYDAAGGWHVVDSDVDKAGSDGVVTTPREHRGEVNIGVDVQIGTEAGRNPGGGPVRGNGCGRTASHVDEVTLGRWVSEPVVLPKSQGCVGCGGQTGCGWGCGCPCVCGLSGGSGDVIGEVSG